MEGLGSAFVNGLGMGLGGAVAVVLVVMIASALGSPILARGAGGVAG